MTTQPNPDEVICPACVHQFRAIPENVQVELRRQHEEIERLKVENAAIGSLLNAYNLGGWTDSLTLIQERDKAHAALRVALEALEWEQGGYPLGTLTEEAITKIKEVLP